MENVAVDYSAPFRAAWVLIYLACGVSLIPIPVLGFLSIPIPALVLLCIPMLVAAFILSVVVLIRGGLRDGIVLLLISAVVCPVIAVLGPALTTFAWAWIRS